MKTKFITDSIIQHWHWWGDILNSDFIKIPDIWNHCENLKIMRWTLENKTIEKIIGINWRAYHDFRPPVRFHQYQLLLKPYQEH